MIQTTRLQLSGLTCSACEKIVTKRLLTIKEVEKVAVSAPTGIVSITALRPITKDAIIKVLEGTHYKVVQYE